MHRVSRKNILILSFIFILLFLGMHTYATIQLIAQRRDLQKDIQGINIIRHLSAIQREMDTLYDLKESNALLHLKKTREIESRYKKINTLFKDLQNLEGFESFNLNGILNSAYLKVNDPENQKNTEYVKNGSELSIHLDTLTESIQKVFHSMHLITGKSSISHFYLYYASIRIPRLFESITRFKKAEFSQNKPNAIQESLIFLNLNLNKFSLETEMFGNDIHYYKSQPKEKIIEISQKYTPLISGLSSQISSARILEIVPALNNLSKEISTLQENLFNEILSELNIKGQWQMAGSIAYVTILTSLLFIFSWLIVNYYKSRNKYEALVEALTRSRKILIYENNPSRIYDELCQFISRAGYELVWIGFALEDEDKTVLPISYHGPASEYMKDLVVHWGDSNLGSGLVGNTIRSGDINICHDIRSNPDFAPWREKALRFGILSAAALPLNYNGNTIGVIMLYSSHKFAFTKRELDEVQDLIDDLMFNISILRIRRDRDTARAKLEIYNKQLEKKVEEKTRQIIQTQDATLFSLGALVEARDQETGNHIIRTREYTKIILDEALKHEKYKNCLSTEISDYIYRAAPLHDIGKVGVPDNILGKPGRLSEKEHKIIQEHTLIGARSIHSATLTLTNPGFLKIAEEIVRNHHEKWDGSGYPDGLKGEEIPLSARIMSIADIYDALFFKRVYKSAMEHSEVIETMKSMNGSAFDPYLFEIFLKVADKFHDIARKYNDDVPEN